MNATELFHKDGRPTGVWYCGECRVAHRTEPEAAACCSPAKCQTCGKECRKHWLICDDCRRAKEQTRERELFEKAEKIKPDQYTGPVYCDGFGSTGFFASLDDLLDYCADDHEKPEYVWCCTVESFVCADVSDVTERIADEAYEDFDTEDLSGLDDLKAALDKFNEVNKDHKRWDVDYERAVVL